MDIGTLIVGLAGGAALGAVAVWLSTRRSAVASPSAFPADADHVVDLLRRLYGAAAACIVAPNADPLWSKDDPVPSASRLDRTVVLAAQALGDGREHVVREDDLFIAVGDGRYGVGMLFGSVRVDDTIVHAATRDLRHLLASYQVERGRRTPPMEMARNTPEWLVPQTVQGIGAALCEHVLALTGRPCAVVARDRATDDACVVALSTGADRRLMGMYVDAGSVVGRACVGDVATVGVGGELFGDGVPNRRRREAEGVAYSLRDGVYGVGALVVFGSYAEISAEMNGRLSDLAHDVGALIGRAATVQSVAERPRRDELTGHPNRGALEAALAAHAHGPCALVSLYVNQLEQLDAPAQLAVLRHVARVFRRALRDYDVAARVDERHFALFLPDTPLTHAFDVADRICHAVGESGFEFAGGQLPLTCTVGVAAVPETVSEATALLPAAEDALRQARQPAANVAADRHHLN